MSSESPLLQVKDLPKSKVGKLLRREIRSEEKRRAEA